MIENRVLKKSVLGGWGGRRMRYPAAEKLEIIRLVETFVVAGAAHAGPDRHPEVDLLRLV